MKLNLNELKKIADQQLKDLNYQKLNEIQESTITPKNPEGFSYENIIRMTAAKFTCWCVEFDDIYNELIVFFLNVIKKYSDTGEMKDGWDNYTYGLSDPVKFTFKIIKNKAIDIYRKYRKEYDSSLELLSEVEYETEGTPYDTPDVDGMLKLMSDEFRNSYPIMSRPWIYITLKFAASGIIPESDLEPYGLYIPNREATTGPKCDIRDIDIIRQMGFKGSKPSSYYSLKSEVNEELLRYLSGKKLFEL